MNPVTPITYGAFIAAFPEFGNPASFPAGGVNFWAGMASLLMNTPRWGNMLNNAMMLFIAHNVALEAWAAAGATAGGIPGINRGVVSSEAAGAVNVSYDTANALVPDAGHWNLTTYGTRLMWLVNMFGAGPVQMGANSGSCCGGFFALLDSLAWNMQGSNMGGCTYISVGPGWRR